MDVDGSGICDEEEQRPGAVSLHLNVDAGGGCGGSDSGLDVTPAASCDSSLASGCYDPCKSPLGPFSPIEAVDGGGGGGPSSLPCYHPVATNSYRPSTPTWRRSAVASTSASAAAAVADRPPKLPNNMSSSFHFETNRNSPPRTEGKKTDLNTAAKQSKISTVRKLVNTYDMAKSLDKYATLPRRRKRSKENIAAVTAPSTGVTAAVVSSPTAPKEPSLNRAASLRRKHIEQGALAQNAAAAAAAAVASSSASSACSSMSQLPLRNTPPRSFASKQPTVAVKTKIYHEVRSQTCLTNEDITKMLSGCVLSSVENRIETNNAEVQVDLMEKRINALETELKEKTEQLDCKTREFDEQQEYLKTLQERLNQEDSNTSRKIDEYSLKLCNIFQIHDCVDRDPSFILLTLKKQYQERLLLILEQQKEVTRLKTLCFSLHKDLDKSYTAQKSLLVTAQTAEIEYMELQDFMQAEKTAITETIRELEKELYEHKEQLTVKEHEASQIMEQCTHLVRISEQRRQENLSLQAKMNMIKNRSRELLQQQETSASSAIVGLSALGKRLDSLLDRLVKSYSISEVDIEDEVYFNEAYINGDSSSPDSEEPNGLSKKSDSNSLMSAIVFAIKSAPIDWHKGKIDKNQTTCTNSQESPSSSKHLHMSESMKELRRTCNPVYKRNVSTGDLLSQMNSLNDSRDLQSAESESLNNLSEAIVARQRLEQNINITSPMIEDFEFLEDLRVPDASLLDQVIDLDNTVTKLLKVITIVQANGKEQPLHQERHEVKYTNGQSIQGSTQSDDSDGNTSYKQPPVVSMQELNASSSKALNEEM